MHKECIISIGKKYTFTEIDKKKFDVKYIDNINENISSKIKDKLLVINSNSKDCFRLIKDKKCIKVEEFLSKNLKKLYIPKDKTIKNRELESISSYTKSQYILKRIVDFAIILPLIIISLPIVLYSIYKIKKESPDGPIFFKQTRVGKDGKKFICYKFRSMRTNVDYFNKYTQQNDPRIFKWGEIMRKTRIDELPQIINVIKGEMHVIGPRAEWDILVEEYKEKIPYYCKRHVVAPGITGWAQVNYHYGNSIEDAYQKLMYDLYYIKNWSLWLELKIIFKTIFTIINRKGH